MTDPTRTPAKNCRRAASRCRSSVAWSRRCAPELQSWRSQGRGGRAVKRRVGPGKADRRAPARLRAHLRRPRAVQRRPAGRRNFSAPRARPEAVRGRAAYADRSGAQRRVHTRSPTPRSARPESAVRRGAHAASIARSRACRPRRLRSAQAREDERRRHDEETKKRAEEEAKSAR